jgi:hypothetical protein
MTDRLYCTVDQLVASLDLIGAEDETELLDYIRQASDYIDQEIGKGSGFIPVTAARRFDGKGIIHLYVDPLLAITSIVEDGDTLLTTDYLLYPRNRYWDDGPYTRITIDPDATTLNAWTYEDDVVVITGRWGLYEKTVATGETVSLAAAGTTDLAVASGASVSPGMILKIEDEQCLVTATGASENATSLLSAAVTTSDTTISVDDGSEFSAGEELQIGTEDFKILKINTNDLYVARSWNGTAKAAHLDNAQVKVYRTYTIERGLNGTTAAAHTSKAASQYIPPRLVNYFCRQIAALMLKKAKSGFAGKTGNVDLGEIFYHQEFPKDALKELKKTYRIKSI